ncbi:hypothetical protein Tco_0370922 [Tanacetum coccineum]
MTISQGVWESKDMTVAGARETVWQSWLYATDWDARALMQGIWATMQRNRRESQRGLKTTRSHKEKMIDFANKQYKVFLLQVTHWNSALGEAISWSDSCLIALQNKQNEFEKVQSHCALLRPDD